MSKIKSNNNKTCKFKLEKNKIFGLIKAKNVSIHKKIHTKESAITDLNFLRLLIIKKQHSIYINII